MTPRIDAHTAVRARWLTALTDERVVYANWKPDDDTTRPDPGESDVWVQESYVGETAEDGAMGRSPRFRTYTASVQLMVHVRRDLGVKPALDLIDAMERALVTGDDITMTDGFTPVLVFDTETQSPREDGSWYAIPFILFYRYTVALTAAA